MVPISKPNELSLGGYAQTQRASQQAYYETSLYGEPDKGVATMIVWSHGGGNVGVIGSWDNWQTRCGSFVPYVYQQQLASNHREHLAQSLSYQLTYFI